MKKLHLKLLCTAALLAALPLAACTNMDKGKETTQGDSLIVTQELAENCPDCKDGEDNDDCPDCKDGKENDDCPDCNDEDNKGCPDEGKCRKPPKKRVHGRNGHGKIVPPKGSIGDRKKLPVPPKRPVAPPDDDDVILPDPPVDDKLPKN